MNEANRVTLEVGDDERTVNVHDDTGELTVGDVTFRFDTSGLTSVGSTDEPADDESHDRVGDGDVATSTNAQYIAQVDDIPSAGTLRFEVFDGRYGVEGILQRTDEGVLAWENSCPHKPEVRLDKGFGALVNDGQLVCHKHGARFNCDDGFCTRGPCRGSVLRAIGVETRDGDVFVADERFDGARALDA